MSEVISSGLTLTIPTLGEENWSDSIRDNCFEKISAHDHTGGGLGLQISSGGLQTSAVITAKINDLAVTTAKINDAAVTNVKLAPVETTYVPTTGAGGSMTWTGVTVTRASHMKIGTLVHMSLHILGTVGGTPDIDLTVTIPYPGRATADQFFPVLCRSNGANQVGYATIPTSFSSTLYVRLNQDAVWTAGASTGVVTNFTYIST